MEWKLERTAPRRVRTEEEMLWENVMRVLAKDMKQKRRQGSSKVFDEVNPTYSDFKSNFLKRLSAEVPVASSPVTTRWRQSQTRDFAAYSFEEEPSTTDLPETSGSVLKITPEEETLILGSYKEPLKAPIKGSFETSNSTLLFCKASHALDRGWKENIALKGQKCLNQLFSTQKVAHQVNGKMQLCERSQCAWKCCKDGVGDESFHLKRFGDVNYSILQPEVKIHLTGLRNDYYLNILDWNFQNLVAIALGSSVYVWNGENHNGIEHIDLSLTCNYVSSVSWVKEGTCLAVGTSEGEVQLLDVATKKRLRNMLGHLSVVGALSWNHCILSSGSRLGRVYHHDVRVAQHHVGTLHHKQAVCALKWSLDGRLLSSGCSDGLLTIWPRDSGVSAQGQPLKVIPQPTAVKAMDWCPWQSAVLAVGGGMKDGRLHILDINTGQSIQTPSTNSQICSLIWLPKTREIATGQGTPENDVTVWACPALARSGGFFGHRGRVLHLALSPDQTRVFSAAADGTARVWNCC
ncbi:PREDICTED: cell division cycle protein 20 homolog B isoform X1 [Ceratotherium simum simum]|uniref:Cell division cycle protein 20 homolog B isoform X1 n=1 Tax=Ceratotherium simum simum TaxID=73337 RepID=A0ABM0HAA1_CERSS|nr:PREDICTED: cell division cycle protein 20 homolog B isoform X1 [Ceratotherium simum simum]